MTRKISWFTAMLMGLLPMAHGAPESNPAGQPTSMTQAAPSDMSAPATPSTSAGAATSTDAPVSADAAPAPAEPAAPVRTSELRFSNIAPAPGSFKLLGTRPDGQIEFGVRSDEVVT
ncbi:MAG: cellulose synthase regulator BcsB, partial [Mixta calida]|nr:cellulose synthase regulator BcsB [Mixta calida]